MSVQSDLRSNKLTAHERRKAAAILGSRGGKKGGRARADSLTPKERRELSARANEARGARNRGILELPLRVSTSRGKRKVCNHCGESVLKGQAYRDGKVRRFHASSKGTDATVKGPGCDRRAARHLGEL